MSIKEITNGIRNINTPMTSNRMLFAPTVSNVALSTSEWLLEGRMLRVTTDTAAPVSTKKSIGLPPIASGVARIICMVGHTLADAGSGSNNEHGQFIGADP